MTQALLVGLVAMFGKMDNQFGESFFQRPIVLCPLTGLVLGDLPMGLAVGGALEAMFLGSIGFGAYVPPDEIIGGVLACSFAITLGEGPETAIALAVPIASLAVSIKSGFYSIMSVFARLSERYAEKGSVRGSMPPTSSSVGYPRCATASSAGSRSTSGPTQLRQ